MTVHDGLPCRNAAVHAHVEALDPFVLREHLPSHLIKEQVDRAPLGLVEVEEGRRVPARHDQRVQRRHGMRIVERDGQLVLRDYRAVRWEAEEAVGYPFRHASANLTHVGVVSRTLVSVALVAESLEVRDVIRTTVASWQDVIDLKPPFIRWDAAQLAAMACSLQDLVAHGP